MYYLETKIFMRVLLRANYFLGDLSLVY